MANQLSEGLKLIDLYGVKRRYRVFQKSLCKGLGLLLGPQ